MVYGDYKVKKRIPKFLGYIVIIACISILLHVFIPVRIPEVSYLQSRVKKSATVYISQTQGVLSFYEGRVKIEATDEIMKNIAEIVYENVSLMTVAKKRLDHNEYLVGFSNGRLYAISMEDEKSIQDAQDTIVQSYTTKLSTIPITATWYGRFILILTSDDKGRVFLQVLRKNTRNSSLKITKTLVAPFKPHGGLSLYSTNYGILIHAQNTLYAFKGQGIEVYEKNVCALPAVVENTSFTIATLLKPIDGLACKGTSSSAEYSRLNSYAMSFHAMKRTFRVLNFDMQWNFLPLPYVLPMSDRVEFTASQYENSKTPQFSYAYGEKHYTIAIQ